jgi:hypothetical protein
VIPFALPVFNLSEQERKIVTDVLSNGCGPGQWKELFGVSDHIFKPACDWHDFRFWRGAPKGYKEEAFRRANMKFLSDMLECCDRHSAGEQYYKQAEDYYLLVKAGGRLFFNWGVEKIRADLQSLSKA